MIDWRECLISSSLTIKEVMNKLNELSGRGLYVVDCYGHLLGSVTDGDLRRSLIKGIDINELITSAMNKNAIYVYEDVRDFEKTQVLEKYKIHSIPVIDREMIIQGIFTSEKTRSFEDIQVVLLAGGMGTRLGEITKKLPKPMVEVAGKPILERILCRLLEQGFSNFYLSVNYKAEVIENYFTDGKEFNCSISYLRESKRLGTAGPLSLLKNNGRPIVVMNGDLLTHVDVGHILNYHFNSEAKVTVCVREHGVQVPFGVVTVDDGYVGSFTEKPTYSFNVNAGIYVINPSVLDTIPKDEYYDMSSLLSSLLDEGARNISCYPIIEGWIDVGRESDLIHAQELYSKRDK